MGVPPGKHLTSAFEAPEKVRSRFPRGKFEKTKDAKKNRSRRDNPSILLAHYTSTNPQEIT